MCDPGSLIFEGCWTLYSVPGTGCSCRILTDDCLRRGLWAGCGAVTFPTRQYANDKNPRPRNSIGIDGRMNERTITGQYVVMGVSGSGKSSVASTVASRTGGVFLDADDFHPESNKKKMAEGTPLTDEDRWGWLDILNRELKERMGDPRPLFLACSALRQAYRDRIAAGLPDLRFIYLHGSEELIRARMQARKNHFMPPALLESQFQTLEEPRDAIRVSIADPVPVIIDNLIQQIGRQHEVLNQDPH
jgi:gluconokinase